MTRIPSPALSTGAAIAPETVESHSAPTSPTGTRTPASAHTPTLPRRASTEHLPLTVRQSGVARAGEGGARTPPRRPLSDLPRSGGAPLRSQSPAGERVGTTASAPANAANATNPTNAANATNARNPTNAANATSAVTATLCVVPRQSEEGPRPASMASSQPPSPMQAFLPADHQAIELTDRISAARAQARTPEGERPASPTTDFIRLSTPLSAQTPQTPQTLQTLQTLQTPSPVPRDPPRQASGPAFFLAQNARHAIPVMGVRTVVQGVIAPALSRAIASSPDAALAAQVTLVAMSLSRRVLSQLHSEANPRVANRGFAGHSGALDNSTPRRAWQAVQTVGIIGGDVAALSLTLLARSRPELVPLAQAVAMIHTTAHLQSQFREMLRPAINTVHVGNGDPAVPQPPERRNLRGADMPQSMRAGFGTAAAVIDFASQMLAQLALGGQSASTAPQGLALAAGAIAGFANMVTSSVEDHLVDNASARRMQQTHPSHVTHLHGELANPFTRTDLGRQAERVDTRIFNTMVPPLIALGVMQALQPSLDSPQVPDGGRYAAQAGVHALATGVLLGSLLALTVKSYQMNDDLRRPGAAARPQEPA